MDDSNPSWSTKVIALVAIIALGAYMVNFWLWPNWEGTLSKDSGTWGEFGDYMGGILNPLVAFGAFLWLVESVRTQRRELSATRDALRDSQQAQRDQADTSLLAAKIQAINVELSTVTAEVGHLRARERFIVEHQNRGDSPTTFRNEYGEIQSMKDALHVLNGDMVGLKTREGDLLGQLRVLTSQYKPTVEETYSSHLFRR